MPISPGPTLTPSGVSDWDPTLPLIKRRIGNSNAAACLGSPGAGFKLPFMLAPSILIGSLTHGDNT